MIAEGLIEQFTNRFKELLRELEQLSFADDGKIVWIKQAFDICNDALVSIDRSISEYHFSSEEEEIHFFKVCKPQILSRHFYYNSLLRFELHKPIGTEDAIRSYREKELKKLNVFFQDHFDFYLYYRSEAKYLDDILFRRYQKPAIDMFPFLYYGLNEHCSTKYDILLGRVMANEIFQRHLCSLPTTVPNVQNEPKTQHPTEMSWSASKVALAELLYALHATGALGTSIIDIKTLSKFAATAFNVQIGNIYKVFEEIRLRKKNRTAFIDLLKVSLLQRMDADDDKSL